MKFYKNFTPWQVQEQDSFFQDLPGGSNVGLADADREGMSDLRRTGAARRPNPLDKPEAFDALAELLWTERELLEQLLFKLVTEHLVISSGRTRWLPLVDDEVKGAIERLREHEMARSIESDSLAARYEIAPDATLRMLIELAPAPWDELLAEQRDVLRRLAGEVDALAAENRRLLRACERASRPSGEVRPADTANGPRGGKVTALQSTRTSETDRSGRRRTTWKPWTP